MFSPDEVVTSGKENYAFKICKCYKCGIERRATFNFDFYRVDLDGEDLLQCEKCLMKEHFGTATPPTLILHPDGKIEKKNDHDPNLN